MVKMFMTGVKKNGELGRGKTVCTVGRNGYLRDRSVLRRETFVLEGEIFTGEGERYWRDMCMRNRDLYWELKKSVLGRSLY